MEFIRNTSEGNASAGMIRRVSTSSIRCRPNSTGGVFKLGVRWAQDGPPIGVLYGIEVLPPMGGSQTGLLKENSISVKSQEEVPVGMGTGDIDDIKKETGGPGSLLVLPGLVWSRIRFDPLGKVEGKGKNAEYEDGGCRRRRRGTWGRTGATRS